MRYLIIKLLAVFALLVGMTTASFALPACPSSGYFDNCYGTYVWADGDKYVGDHKDNMMHGQGTYTHANGDKYVGNFKDDKMHGQGTYTFASGDKYVGESKDNKAHGQGTYTHANGAKYVGEFKDDLRNGQGTYTFANEDKYVGEFKDNKMHGQGTYTYADGFQKEGIWKNDIFQYAKKQTSSNIQTATVTCKDDPILCTTAQLCTKATVQSGGIIYWNNSKPEFQIEAKSRGITCGIFTAKNDNCPAKLVNCTDEHICVKATIYSFTTKRFNWSKSYKKKRFVQEAKSRGLTCAVKTTKEITPKPKTCKDSPTLCTVAQLCTKASHYSGGKKAWRKDYSSKKYVTEAKKNGVSCGVQVVVKKEKPVDNKTYKVASGTGFYVSNSGHIITNHHVIDGCKDMKVISQGRAIETLVLANDPLNDLALLKAKEDSKTYFSINNKQPEELQDVIVAGFPFGDKVSSSIKFTQGIVSSLTGIGDNYSQMQIDAALQPGNSGGPIMDNRGNVIGVAVAKLSLKKIMDDYGVVPENTNFGIKASAVRNLMVGNSIIVKDPSGDNITKSQLVKLAKEGTVHLTCWMTVAQIEKAIKDETGKVLFKEFQK